MRSAVKHIAERALIVSGFAAANRRRMRGRSLVLAYHNVLPPGAAPIGDLPNHLPLATFAAQLAALRETHDVVPLADLLTASAGTSRRPRAAITFDDAYRGAVVHGVPELVRQGLPATIFVAPAFLGGRSFWWDALATRADGLEPALRDRALHELRGDDGAVRAWASAAGRPVAALPSEWCAASEAELLRAAQGGITLGSHSWSHPNLTRLGPDELSQELTRPLEWLRERVPIPSPLLAYPYGLHDRTVRLAAERAGYQGALAIDGGWLPPVPRDRYALPRVNVPPGLSLPGFVLRGAGLLTK